MRARRPHSCRESCTSLINTRSVPRPHQILPTNFQKEINSDLMGRPQQQSHLFMYTLHITPGTMIPSDIRFVLLVCLSFGVVLVAAASLVEEKQSKDPNTKLSSHDSEASLEFEDWAFQHNKHYDSPSTKESKRKVYEENIARWKVLNQIPGGAIFGPENEPHADLTPNEYVQMIANCESASQQNPKDYGAEAVAATMTRTTAASSVTVGDEDIQHIQGRRRTMSFMYVDWRNQNGMSYVTPVKNQGPHGTCWSFGAAENLEGLNVRQGYPLMNISEQEFISCCAGCQGRSEDVTFEWLLNTTGGRPAMENSYPYDGNASYPCYATDAPRAPVTLHSWGRIRDDGTGLPILFGLEKWGPMGLGVDASCFHGYQSGIVRNCTDSHGINHAVLMVAAGTDIFFHDDDTLPSMVDFFTIKNSWGAKWGESGYVRIEQGKDWWGPLNLIYTE